MKEFLKNFNRTAIYCLALATLIGGWALVAQLQSAAPAPPDSPDWIQGTEDEKFAQVAKHLRGFDVTMFETGHRYIELSWAGRDRNWDYAAYQIDKIRLAIELGIERRPKRGPSALGFLNVAVPQLAEAIRNKDPRFNSKNGSCC